MSSTMVHTLFRMGEFMNPINKATNAYEGLDERQIAVELVQEAINGTCASIFVLLEPGDVTAYRLVLTYDLHSHTLYVRFLHPQYSFEVSYDLNLIPADWQDWIKWETFRSLDNAMRDKNQWTLEILKWYIYNVCYHLRSN